ncbi:MAG: hypothetical protein DRI01_04390 [Chloroflexi bacterium]|nr:MAG: hypothetical protein DRI01_04390 [Chloroflexota bacterium]
MFHMRQRSVAMIFDGKPVDEIADEELEAVVRDHITERQHLEFKTTVNYRDDDERLELLRDIASLANGGGGYLIIGVRDDGQGRAVKFEPSLVGDTARIARSIASLCQDHIVERIDGLEIRERNVRTNPLVVIRVPVSSRVPHMVILKNRTDFYNRYEGGKREMTFGEIKDAFMSDHVALALSRIEAQLSMLTAEPSEVVSESTQQLLAIDDGQRLAKVTFERFRKEVGDKPFFRIAGTPAIPKSDLIDPTSSAIRTLIEAPPGSRPHGWSMNLSPALVELFGAGIRRGIKNYAYLELFKNGHMEFWKPLDEHFCWRQSEEEMNKRPTLYLYPVVEYPVTFLRVYRELVNQMPMESDLLINLCYVNVKGYNLLPYAPGSVGFAFNETTRPYDELHIILPEKRVEREFDPDKTAYELTEQVFNSFGLEGKVIPFFTEEGLFKF